MPSTRLKPSAWSLPSAGALALLVSFALSTQFLFQRALYDAWTLPEIAAAWVRQFGEFLVIAVAILGAVWLAGRVPLRRAAARFLAIVAAGSFGACLGEWLVLALQWDAWPNVGALVVVDRALRWMPIGAVCAGVLWLQARSSASAAHLKGEEINRLRLEQQRVAVQLQILQSQIEPHFLFNTLATIRRLYQTDPARGRTVLADFMHYLQSALPELRERETTLGREVDLITAYLDVLRVRMGPRLEYDVDVPEALRTLRIPPLSLGTLVENAIKHGISDLPEGGRLSIAAWRLPRELVICVADTGRGLAGTGGTGTGLANLRTRLRGLYGPAGRLELAANTPRGLAVTLHVPLPSPSGNAHDDD